MSKLITILIIICFGLSLGAKCPPQEVISPCVCEPDPSEYYIQPMYNIRCGGIDEYDLVQIFEDTSHSLIGIEDKFFNEFVLNNTAIKQLSANVFSDLTFRVIKLDGAYSLTHVSPHAFGTSTPYIEEVFAYGTNLSNPPPNERDIYEAFAHLINLKKLIIPGTSIRTIPSRAFRSMNGIQSQLYRIDMSDPPLNTVHTIDSLAFYDIPALNYIGLKNHRIERIPKYTFAFKEPSNQMLTIDLRGNDLSDQSFEFGSFGHIRRPTVLKLNHNHGLKHLDETVFSSFLDSNPKNVIDLSGCPIVCDCNALWLHSDRTSFRDRVKNIRCQSGKSLWNHSSKDFRNCNAFAVK